MRNINKKGEVTSQIFMYITAVLIAGAILVIGANAILRLTVSGKQASDTMFKDSLTGYFDKVNSLTSGSVRIESFKILSDFDTVCFISRDAIRIHAISTEYDEINNAIIAESADNIFLLSKKSTFSFQVDDISGFDGALIDSLKDLEQSADAVHACRNIVSGKMSIKLRAKGDSVEILDII